MTDSHRRAQHGARRARDVAVSLCAEAARGGVEDAIAGAQKVVDALERRRAESAARAELRRASAEGAARTLRETVKKHAVERESVCEDMARASLLTERVLERLESPANAEAASASRRADALGTLADVLECVCAFSKGGEAVTKACDGLFADAARRGEAGRLAKRSLSVVERAQSCRIADEDAGAERIALKDASTALQRYCEDVENALLDKFAAACANKSYAAARADAEALFEFNGGHSVVSRYVASREMFISANAMEEIQRLRNVVERSVILGEDEYSCTECVRTFFAQIQSAVKKEFQSITAAFDSRAIVVLNTLVHRIAEQRIGAYVETFLTSELRTAASLRQRLALTALSLREIEILNRAIREMTNDDADVEAIDPDVFFGIGCETLVDDECACLDSVPSDDDVLPQRDATEFSLDDLCARYKEALLRVESCVPGTSIESVRARLAEAFLGRVTRLAQRHLRESIAATKSASARLNAWTTREEARADVFEPVLLASRNMNAWLARARDAIDALNSELSPGTVRQMFAVAQSRLAEEMSEVLEAMTTRGMTLVDAKFRGTQRAVDFNDESSFAERETEACVAVVDALDGLAKTTLECLDSANAATLLNEIGAQFYSLLFRHVCRYTYTIVGAMQLKLDVNAYVSWVRKTMTARESIERFEALSTRLNLLVVPEDALDDFVYELEAHAHENIAEIRMLLRLRKTT